MPRGGRHREAGLLLDSARGLTLQLADAGAYALDAPRSARKLLSHGVTLEGARSGFDRLDVDWVGAAQL